MKILLNIIATNKYTYFLDRLLESVDKYFFINEDVSIYVHTNMEIKKFPYDRLTVKKNPIVHEEWPFTTLKRFHHFNTIKKEIVNFDYVFYVDADSLFINNIDNSILPANGLIGTIHPCLFKDDGSPDRNPNSKAYIPYNSNNRYYCGGFFGGSSDKFITMSEILANNIDDDLSRNVMAIWHDESHINKYFYSYMPPAITLDNPFAIAESITDTDVKKESCILFLDKCKIGGQDYFRS